MADAGQAHYLIEKADDLEGRIREVEGVTKEQGLSHRANVNSRLG